MTIKVRRIETLKERRRRLLYLLHTNDVSNYLRLIRYYARLDQHLGINQEISE